MKEELLSICIIGNNDELQTKWTRNFAEGKGYDTKHMIGYDIKTHRIQVKNYLVKLFIKDSSGKKYTIDASGRKIYPKKSRRKEVLKTKLGASGGIITFDKGDRDSFEAITDFYKEFYEVNPPDVPLNVVGLITEPMEITTEEGQDLVVKLDAAYYETEPINNDITAKILEDLTLKMMKSYRHVR